jgi:hypothetical protein
VHYIRCNVRRKNNETDRNETALSFLWFQLFKSTRLRDGKVDHEIGKHEARSRACACACACARACACVRVCVCVSLSLSLSLSLFYITSHIQ